MNEFAFEWTNPESKLSAILEAKQKLRSRRDSDLTTPGFPLLHSSASGQSGNFSEYPMSCCQLTTLSSIVLRDQLNIVTEGTPKKNENSSETVGTKSKNENCKTPTVTNSALTQENFSLAQNTGLTGEENVVVLPSSTELTSKRRKDSSTSWVPTETEKPSSGSSPKRPSLTSNFSECVTFCLSKL